MTASILGLVTLACQSSTVPPALEGTLVYVMSNRIVQVDLSTLEQQVLHEAKPTRLFNYVSQLGGGRLIVEAADVTAGRKIHVFDLNDRTLSEGVPGSQPFFARDDGVLYWRPLESASLWHVAWDGTGAPPLAKGSEVVAADEIVPPAIDAAERLWFLPMSGHRVVYASRAHGGTLVVVHVQSDEASGTSAIGYLPYAAVDGGPNVVCREQRDDRFVLFDVSTGAVTQLEGLAGRIDDVTYLPRARALIYSRLRTGSLAERSDVHLYELDNGQDHVIVKDTRMMSSTLILP